MNQFGTEGGAREVAKLSVFFLPTPLSLFSLKATKNMETWVDDRM